MLPDNFLKAINWHTFFCIAIIAFIVAFALCEYKGDVWENTVRNIYYETLLNKPVPATYSVNTDSEGVPFIIYKPTTNSKADTQYLPTTTGIFALQYLHQYQTMRSAADKQHFFSCIQHLKDSLTYWNNAGFYRLQWQQPYYHSVSPPWVSALANGKAIEAFVAAYRVSEDSIYLSIAFDLLRAFYIPREQGGFTIKRNTGWWYEEYADTSGSTPQVMNGHAYAVLAVYRLWQFTKNDSAKFIFDKGVAALLSNLAKYDAGNGQSYYDLQGKKADKQYHQIAVELMLTFYQITGNEKFNFYYKKWNAPLQQPYILRMLKEKNRSGIILFLVWYAISFLLLFIFVKRATKSGSHIAK